MLRYHDAIAKDFLRGVSCGPGRPAVSHGDTIERSHGGVDGNRMGSAAGKWLTGCAIGCGVLLLGAVIALVAGTMYCSRTFRGIQEARESHEALVSRFGEIDSFVPSADGTIAPERVEAFLAVRTSLDEARERVDAAFAEFPPRGSADGGGSVWTAFRVIGSLAGLVNPIGEYVDRRNESLMEHDMPLGEYVYLYALAYYSWLGHEIEAGPVIAEGDGAGESVFDDEDSMFAPEKIRRRLRRYLLAVVGNQLEALPSADAGGDADAWRRRLEAEIRRLEERPGHLPWQDGLPEAMEASLAPYRDRLEATWHAPTNPFEIPPREGEGASWSIEID